MATLVEKIKGIEDEMARTQKNKATSAHLGMLKAKLVRKSILVKTFLNTLITSYLLALQF